MTHESLRYCEEAPLPPYVTNIAPLDMAATVSDAFMNHATRWCEAFRFDGTNERTSEVRTIIASRRYCSCGSNSSPLALYISTRAR